MRNLVHENKIQRVHRTICLQNQVQGGEYKLPIAKTAFQKLLKTGTNVQRGKCDWDKVLKAISDGQAYTVAEVIDLTAKNNGTNAPMSQVRVRNWLKRQVQLNRLAVTVFDGKLVYGAPGAD